MFVLNRYFHLLQRPTQVMKVPNYALNYVNMCNGIIIILYAYVEIHILSNMYFFSFLGYIKINNYICKQAGAHREAIYYTLVNTSGYTPRGL